MEQATLPKTKGLIESLQNCESTCNYCATACLQEENVSAMAECIKLDLNCADICNLTSRFLSRNADRRKDIVEICRDICADCAAECEKHDHDHCRQCAVACRQCEEQCQSYLTNN